MMARIVDDLCQTWLETDPPTCKRPYTTEETCYSSDSETPCEPCKVLFAFDKLTETLRGL